MKDESKQIPGWDHRAHVTKMCSPMTGEVRYLCTFGNPFDVRSTLVRYFSQADNLSALEWANEHSAVRIDIVGEGYASETLSSRVREMKYNE